MCWKSVRIMRKNCEGIVKTAVGGWAELQNTFVF